jgi:hypothetical protein
MRRFFIAGRLLHRQAFDPLPRLIELLLAELEVLATAGDRGDRIFQAQLAFLEGSQGAIQLG